MGLLELLRRMKKGLSYLVENNACKCRERWYIVDMKKKDKSIRISHEIYQKIRIIKKNTGCSIKYIIEKAIKLLNQ